MGKKIQAHLAQHLSTFLVGFTGILGKTIHQNPILIVFFRTFFAAIGMFPFFFTSVAGTQLQSNFIVSFFLVFFCSSTEQFKNPNKLFLLTIQIFA